MASKDSTHPDVEYSVEDESGKERIYRTMSAAQQAAMEVAMTIGGATLDVLIWSDKGAEWYGGPDAVERYDEDPEASVFERYEIKVNFEGMIP